MSHIYQRHPAFVATAHANPRLLVLRLLIREWFSRPSDQSALPSTKAARRGHSPRELPKLMPNHILRYPHIIVDLPIIHLKDEAYEVR